MQNPVEKRQRGHNDRRASDGTAGAPGGGSTATTTTTTMTTAASSSPIVATPPPPRPHPNRLIPQRPPPPPPPPPPPSSSSSSSANRDGSDHHDQGDSRRRSHSPNNAPPPSSRRRGGPSPSPSPSPSSRRDGTTGAALSLSRHDSGASSYSAKSVDFDASVHLTSISSPDHLRHLTPDFLSGDADRPLLHVDESGHEYTYYLNPMRNSVLFILMVEMLERFSFYGINYTTTAYLTGE
jgi:POT family proton-dependent oligopeptide transporter